MGLQWFHRLWAFASGLERFDERRVEFMAVILSKADCFAKASPSAGALAHPARPADI
jgi:hypothetical protein